MALVWGDQSVEEANLTVQMSALRKALGERRDSPAMIVTVPGRGYSFVADVSTGGANGDVVVESHSTSQFVIEEEIVIGSGSDSDENGWEEAPLITSGGAGVRDSLVKQNHSVARQSDLPLLQPGATTRRLRSRILLPVISLVLILTAAAVALWLFVWRTRAIDPSPGAPAAQTTIRRFATHGGVPYRVAVSPDGKLLVYLQRINEKDSLWLGQIETNTSVPLTEPRDVGTFDSLVFSPDGSSIYLSVRGGSRAEPMLARMPVLGGVMTELIPQ